MIVTTVALTGGTVTFSADAPYIWDTQGSSWVAAGPSGSTGAIREIRFATTNAASQSSATQIPANAIVVLSQLSVTTPYSAGATIAIGQTGSTSLLQGTGDNLPQTNGLYEVPQDTSWGGTARAVLVTITGSPSAGVGVCITHYCMPDA